MKKFYTKNKLFAIDALFSTFKGFKKAFGVNKKMLVFLLFFVQAVIVAQTIGDYKSVGNVSFTSAINWQVWNGSWVNAATAPSSYSFGSASLLTVSASDILTVSGTVSISIPKITIIGTVNFANNSFLTLGSSANWCTFTINPGGKLGMGSGNDQSTFVLYGDYVNNGTTNFYKSNVIITGDLISPATSTLQNNGNVIVGGNIIGAFSITGNDQGPVIYAVNPNATVTITPATIDSGVIPGVQPIGESSSLQDLVNLVIYEGSSACTFTLKDPTTNPSTCIGGSATITIEAISNSTYQWQINSGSTGWSNIVVQTNNSLVITNVVANMTGNKYRVKVTNSSCTKNSNYVTLSIDPPTVAGTASSNQTVCSGSSLSNITLSGQTGTIQWQLSNDSINFSSILGATGAELTSAQMSIFAGTRYYRAAVTNAGCNTLYSNVITKTINALPNNTTSGFVATTICTGGIPQLTFDAEDSSFSTPYNISYQNVSTGISYTVSIPNGEPFIFTPGDNPISDADYILVSINKAGCVRTTDFGKTRAELRVRPIPTALISGTSAVCVGSTSPNIIINNPRTNQITVTYSINSIVQATVDIGAEGQISFPVPTTTAGDFTYRLISVVYKFSPSCSTALSANVTVTINAFPTITSATAAASPICTNTTTTLTANGVTGAGTTVTWWSLTGGTGTNYGTGLTLSNAVPGTYFARVTGTCTPAVEASVTVTEQAFPNAGTNGTLTVCAGTTPNDAQLFAALVGPKDAGGSWSALVAGVYTYTVLATSPCTVNATATVTVTQQALPNAGTNGTLTVCAGTTPSNVELFAALLGTPTAGGSWSAPVAGVYTYTVAATAPCTEVATATVTVDKKAPAADAGSAFTKTCTSNPDGKTIGVAPVTGVTYAWLPTAGLSDAAIANPNANPSATTIYTVTATNSNSGCTAISSVLVTVDIANTITWKKSGLGIVGWSNGDVPSLNDIIVFEDDYSSDAVVNGCFCSVSAGKNVTIKTGGTMKIVNGVSVLGTGTLAGILTFENNSSLVQINDAAVNVGTIIYKRATTPILDTDYVYWASPVIAAKLGAIQTATLYYSFYAAGNSWVKAYSTTTMANGIGYIVRGAGTGLASGPRLARTATFIGLPNNGINDVNITAIKSNLIGNPYPSAIDPDAFLEANKAALEGTLYFWTHKSAIQLAGSITVGTAGSGAYAYTSGDYAAYTLTGGVGTSLTGGVASSKIAAGQSFMAIGSSQGGTARFTNSMRLTKGGEILDNSQFLRSASGSKTSKVATTNEIVKSRIWLNLSNTQAAFKQTLIGYVNGATNHYDRGFDAVTINGNAYVDFYSINNDSLLTIQARALPIPEADTVPLGFSSAIGGDFTISIDKTDGLLTAMDVFLEDKLSKNFTNLKTSTYTFSSGKGTFNDRFVLSYANKTLELTDFETTLENQVVVSNKNKQLIITSTADAINKVVIFDTTARKVYEKRNVDSQELKILDLISSQQVLFVKVVLQDGKSITKKVIY